MKAKTANKKSHYLLLTNIGQLLTLRGPSAPRRGTALNDVALIENAAVLCGGGKIISVRRERDILRDAWIKSNKKKISEFDCRGRVVLPGFVDCHTHPAFIEPRLIDFEQRINGASYEQISAAGGGIRSSLASVRAASRKELSNHVLEALEAMLRHGTTTVEAKSGYGLTAEAEIKTLQAIADAAKRWPGTVTPTLLAAHVVPPEYAGQADDYVTKICEEIIPLAAQRQLAESVDVFCERGAFTLEQSERLLQVARRHGLATRAHVCQFTPSRLTGLLSCNPASLDHMDCVADEDIRALSSSETVAVLLPGATYFLGHKGYPDARKLIDSGVPVALATDYNPGTSPTPSMLFMLSLACTHMRMTPAEAIAAATVNAACALRFQGRKGTIEAGKDADLAIVDVRDYREIAYWFAWNRCAEIVTAGEVQNFG